MRTSVLRTRWPAIVSAALVIALLASASRQIAASPQTDQAEFARLAQKVAADESEDLPRRAGPPAITYAVVAVTSTGSEEAPATITIQ
jgi:hypothetical protein